MNLAVDLQDLRLKYPRAHSWALAGLDLQIQPGAFYGLLGPNGAGKTSLISFLCGQLDAEYKTALILQTERFKVDKVKYRIGYAPQEIALYSSLTGRENLNFFARMMNAERGAEAKVLDWMDLTDRADDRVLHYSGGMKRRLNLGVALLNKPDLLILDEPTAGVDPQSRLFLFEKLLELKKQNITLIYSTHYMEEVKRICDHVAILNKGKIIAKGPLKDVLGSGDLESRYLELTGRALDA